MVPWLAFLSPEGPGGEVTIFSAGSWTVCSWEIDGKALLPWGVGWWAEMPFAEMSSLVTGVLQEFGKGDVVGRESGEAIGDPSWPIALDQSFFQLFLRKVGEVIPSRAGARPVRMLARVGEQRGLAE
jgi:hypothetical protein